MSIDFDMANFNASFEIIYFNQLASTNQYLIQHKHNLTLPSLCFVQHQTHGYGQRRNVWLNAQGSLAFSLAVRMNVPIHSLQGLSLTIMSLVHQTVSSFSGDKFYLKWPNDLFNHEGKVSGCLIEVLKSEANSCEISIGIGINFSQPLLQEQHFLVGDLHPIRQYKYEILYSLCNKILQLSHHFTHKSFAKDFRSYWMSHDYFSIGESLSFSMNDKQETARYFGLTQEGHVKLKHDNQIKYFNTGMLSLKKNIH